MFSALSLGSTIYLLDKSSSPKKFLVGEVVGVSLPKVNYGFGPTLNTVDLKVKIEDSVHEFNNLPSINTLETYNGGKLIISETKQGILNEVENTLNNRKNILNNISTYESEVEEYEAILKEINPQFAKDKERDDRLLTLENRFDGVESKLDKIFNLIKK